MYCQWQKKSDKYQLFVEWSHTLTAAHRLAKPGVSFKWSSMRPGEATKMSTPIDKGIPVVGVEKGEKKQTN
jgi:hypothetical protein